MSHMKTVALIVACCACMAANTNAMPAESDGAEIIMKIEKINQQLPGVQARQQNKTQEVGAEKPKKSQRTFPVYYVNTKQNGKFGKSLHAFTSEEFHAKYPAKN